MKNLINSVSPFVLLLIPVLVLIALSGLTKNTQVVSKKSESLKIFRMPEAPEEARQTGTVKFTGNSLEIFFQP